MQKPQVIWVDGPTGVGKDFFIDNFTRVYSEAFPAAKVNVVRATDIVLQGESKTEDRKYTEYATPLEKTKSIYKGHLKLIDHVNAIVEQSVEGDIVIVNRSFLSFYVYNWLPVFRDKDLAPDGRALIYYGIHHYRLEFLKELRAYRTLFVNLQLPTGNVSDKVKTLISRAMLRGDGKAVSSEWFSYLVRTYEQVPVNFQEMFDSYGAFSSSDYSKVLETYYIESLTHANIIGLDRPANA